MQLNENICFIILKTICKHVSIFCLYRAPKKILEQDISITLPTSWSSDLHISAFMPHASKHPSRATEKMVLFTHHSKRQFFVFKSSYRFKNPKLTPREETQSRPRSRFWPLCASESASALHQLARACTRGREVRAYTLYGKAGK
jgi:hypothetical protein